MLSRLARLSFLRNASTPLARPVLSRNAHSEVQRPPGSPEEPKDFRPPWVYMVSKAGSWVVIPLVSLYCVFIYDWGDREHVFMPPRRWLARTKSQFFALSPEEEKMLNAEIKVQRVQRLPQGVLYDPNEVHFRLKNPNGVAPTSSTSETSASS